MAEAVLIVMSGNVLGLGVTGVPLMLITLADAGPAVGNKSGNGVDWFDVWFAMLPVIDDPSSRITPLLPRLGSLAERKLVQGEMALKLPLPPMVVATNLIAPPLPHPAAVISC